MSSCQPTSSRLNQSVVVVVVVQDYTYLIHRQAIHGYRETEKSRWSDENLKLFKKMKDLAIPHGIKILPHIHVLDLDRNG